jgi:predicted nucleic acid-binding protein
VTTFLCVDASVAAKWWLPEAHSREAGLLRDKGIRLVAPSLLQIELASVCAQKFRRRQISAELLSDVASQIPRLPVRIVAAGDLLPGAIELATNFHPSLYDCLYAALALREGCPVVTADRPFFDALDAAFPGTMVWIEDVPALLT